MFKFWLHTQMQSENKIIYNLKNTRSILRMLSDAFSCSDAPGAGRNKQLRGLLTVFTVYYFLVKWQR